MSSDNEAIEKFEASTGLLVSELNDSGIEVQFGNTKSLEDLALEGSFLLIRFWGTWICDVGPLDNYGSVSEIVVSPKKPLEAQEVNNTFSTNATCDLVRFKESHSKRTIGTLVSYRLSGAKFFVLNLCTFYAHKRNFINEFNKIIDSVMGVIEKDISMSFSSVFDFYKNTKGKYVNIKEITVEYDYESQFKDFTKAAKQEMKNFERRTTKMLTARSIFRQSEKQKLISEITKLKLQIKDERKSIFYNAIETLRDWTYKDGKLYYNREIVCDMVRIFRNNNVHLYKLSSAYAGNWYMNGLYVDISTKIVGCDAETTYHPHSQGGRICLGEIRVGRDADLKDIICLAPQSLRIAVVGDLYNDEISEEIERAFNDGTLLGEEIGWNE